MAKINILGLIFRHHRFKVFLLYISLIILFNTLLYTHIYTVFHVIPEKHIIDSLITLDFPEDTVCPFKQYIHADLLRPNMNITENSNTWAASLNLSQGEWHPANCSARFLVAVIIPYRNREEHLKIFLNHMHPFLQKQNVRYKIFVIEQEDDKKFNRGKLFNVGFVEALKDKPFPCFIFHDVDLIPQNLNNIYACTRCPRHMSSSIDKYRYNVPYDRNFGGVVAILSDQFKAINGFSNKFYGWGGEDDDFFNRNRYAGHKVCRFSQYISRYSSLFHHPAEPSEDRFVKLNDRYGNSARDGLNSLHYRLKATIDTPTHVKLVVEF